MYYYSLDCFPVLGAEKYFTTDNCFHWAYVLGTERGGYCYFFAEQVVD